MNLEEQYENAKALLIGRYNVSGETTIKFDGVLLKENGLDGATFWYIICPRLKNEGLLVNYYGHLISELRDTPRAVAVWESLERLGQWKMDRDAEKGIFNKSFEHGKSSLNAFNEFLALENQEAQLWQELGSVPMVYTFVVDGKKLEAAYERHMTTLSGAAIRDVMGKTELQEQPTRRENSPNSIRRLITKHPDDGNYYYQDRPISVNTETLYYDVFDILFLHAGQDGSLSYEQIEGQLVKRKYPPAENDDKRNKRIQNAISNENQGFFRNAKVGARVMKNETPDGSQLIVEVVRGMGLKLNNPILK